MNTHILGGRYGLIGSVVIISVLAFTLSISLTHAQDADSTSSPQATSEIVITDSTGSPQAAEDPALTTDSSVVTPSEVEGPAADTTTDTSTLETDEVVEIPSVVEGPIVITDVTPLDTSAEVSGEQSADQTVLATPTLSTDQPDYNPGSIVTVFGHFFSALGNYVLHLVGTNSDGNQSPEVTQNVAADTNGDFTSTFTLDNIFRPLYNLFATDQSGTTVAQTSFTDNIGYDKSGYDKGTATWGTGNQSGYSENDWVQYQYTITGITGAVPNFNVEYDENISNVIFIDGLSNFRVCVDCAVAGSSNSRLADGTPRPPSSDGVGTGQWHAFTPLNINNTYNSGPGTCTGTDALDTPSAQHCFRIDPATINAGNVNFPASFGSETHTVTIFYEAHMAASFVWGTGHESQLNTAGIYGVHAPVTAVPSGVAYGTGIYNTWTTSAFNGAGGISGASKHFNLQDQSDGPKGSIALPIPAVTLPAGSITITKVTNPTPAVVVSFPFTSDFNSFTLDTDPSATNPNTITFGNLPAAMFNFTETQPVVSGWSLLSISCVTNSGTAGSTFATSTVTGLSTINLASGALVTCTYTNKKNQVAPTVTTTIHDVAHATVTSVAAGSTVHDSASVTGTNGVATGNVTFDWFTNSACTGGPAATSGTFALSSGAVDATTFTQGPLSVGSYGFKAHYAGDSNYLAGDGACEPLTVTKVSPTIATTPSVGGVVGTAVHDSATLSGAVSPTGNITFNLYDAGDATCLGAAIFTSTNALSGSSATSGNFTPLLAGTYHWTASYPGDTNNNSAASLCSAETVTITPATPSITTSLSPAGPVAIDASVHDSSTLTGATATAGGTVTYHAYAGSNTCSGTDLLNSTKTVTNGAVPDSDPVSFSSAGTYSFQATYSGDGNNTGPVSSTCSTEQIVVNPNAPTIATTLSETTGNIGDTVHDSSALSGATSNAGGTVTYTVYSDSACSQNAQDAGTKTVSSATVPDSNGIQFNNAGDYYWQAVYSGDSNNNGATSLCSSEHLVINKSSPTISTVPSEGGVVGTTLQDTATLSGGASPAGDVTFSLYSPSDATCSGAATYTETDNSVPYATVIGFVSNSVGTWHWKAHYAGDSNNNPADSVCADEAVTITKASPKLSTTIHDANHGPVTSVDLGSTVHDSAAISGGSNPTGNVSFTFYTSDSCTGDGTSAGSAALAAGVAHPSSDEGPLTAGPYSFKASYEGDAFNNPADAQCEPLTVNKAGTTVTTHVHDGQHNDVTNTALSLGSVVHDNSAVGGQIGNIAPTGTVTYHFYTGAQCSGDPNDQTVAVGSESSATSALGAGSYGYVASYSGDDNYNQSTGACEPFSVNKAQLSINTTVHDAAHTVIPNNGHVALGTVAHDNTTVTGAVGSFPIPAVSFTFDGGAIINAGSAEATFDATSIATLPLAAGNHKFNATVGSDVNYDGATSADEPFIVDKADLSLATEIHNNDGDSVVTGPVDLGTTVHDKATASGLVGGFTPSNNVTFTFYSGGTCDIQGAGAGSVALSGNVAHPSSDEGPLAAGDYSFKASIAGDGDYNGAASDCELLTVNKANTKTDTAIHLGTDHAIDVQGTNIPLGSSIHDNATVGTQVDSLTIGGTVTYQYFTNASCSDTPAASEDVAVGSESSSHDNLTAGDYSFLTSYSGDDNYNGSPATCETVHVNRADLEISTTIHGNQHNPVTSVPLASIVHDTSSVTGQVDSIVPIGAVSFQFFPNNTCSENTGSPVTNTGPDNGAVRSADSSALAAGSYSYQATVAGDDNYNGKTSVCEPLTVEKGTPDPSTDTRIQGDFSKQTIEAGGSIHDTVTITGDGTFTPTGTVTLDFFNNGSCTQPPAAISGAFPLVNGFADASAFSQGPLTAGLYSFMAHYSGDDNYSAADAGCEPVTVVDGSIALSPLTATNTVGANHIITVHVTKNDGTGVTDASGVTVNFSVTSGTATFVGPDSCVTGGAGTCTVTITSTGTGSNTVNATATFTVGGVSLTRATNGTQGPDGTGSATKNYVNAKISITPDTSTNEVGSAHTFVVEVDQDTGSGFVPVPAGTLANAIASPAPTSLDVSDCTDGVNASGQCNVIINSTAVGVFTITARSTVVVGGVTFKLQTNGQGLNSGPATKTYVGAAIALSPLTATNPINQNHVITATVVINPTPGTPAPNGTLVTFSLTNSGGATASFVGGSTCTTAGGTGTCTVTINSPTPGTVTVNASTTVIVSGVTLVRDTDPATVPNAGPNGTGPASKTYVAGKIIVKKVTNPVSDTSTQFAFTTTGTGYNGFSLVGGGQNDSGLLAPGSFSVAEGAVAGWDSNGGVCDGQGNTPASINLAAGATVTCTFTNTERGGIEVTKTTVGGDDTFAFTTIGTGYNAFGITTANNTGSDTQNNLVAGAYSALETLLAGWDKTFDNCGSITVVPGQTATCGVTNVKRASLTLVKQVINNNGGTAAATDWTLTASGPTPISGTSGSSNVTGKLVVPGTYNLSESITPSGYVASPYSCVVNGGAPVSGNSVVLVAGAMATCTITNDDIQIATRTLGFWQTHTAYTSTVFAANFGGGMPIGTTPHKGLITNIQLAGASQLFGGFYAGISKTTTGAARTALDKARMQLLQQLLAAKLNCAAFGCFSGTVATIAAADAAYYAGINATAILASASALDAYNNSGDSVAIAGGGSATPGTSQSYANLFFWNAP